MDHRTLGSVKYGCLGKMGVDEVRDIVEYNKIIHEYETKKGKECGSPVHSSECPDTELRKIVLYNIRYDREKNPRSDVDVLDEYHFVMESRGEIENIVKKLNQDIYALDNPSALERVARTVVTWTWSDDPRKDRIRRRKELQDQLKSYQHLLSEIEFQLALYRSVISVTTTTTIKTKSTKLKSKYAKKLKSRK